jgi:CheY-like chemotaxis protein
MNFGPKNTSGSGGKNKRRRGRRGPSNRPGEGKGQHQRSPGVFTHPMDHSYRAALRGGNSHPGAHRGMGTQYLQPDPEPIPQHHRQGAARIFAFIDDLFFLAKINEISRKLNVKVEFVKSEKDILERLSQNGDEKPSLIIFDLNNASAKPLATIPRLKKELKKGTTIIGFLSHVQGDLKIKAMDAGCDMVIPRSAFSQNLPQLLRRHGAPEETEIQ